MVVQKILSEGARFAFKYGPRVLGAEQKILRGVGYSHKSAKGISHGLFAGAVAGNLLKLDNGIEPDGEISQKEYGNSANTKNKTRSRQFSYSRKRNRSRFCSCKKRRYARYS